MINEMDDKTQQSLPKYYITVVIDLSVSIQTGETSFPRRHLSIRTNMRVNVNLVRGWLTPLCGYKSPASRPTLFLSHHHIELAPLPFIRFYVECLLSHVRLSIFCAHIRFKHRHRHGVTPLNYLAAEVPTHYNVSCTTHELAVSVSIQTSGTSPSRCHLSIRTNVRIQVSPCAYKSPRLGQHYFPQTAILNSFRMRRSSGSAFNLV